MYLRQLRYFVAIVENGSFSKAAQSLRIAHPALSLHVRNMEQDFGAALLERTPRGVATTTAGEIVLRDARAMIRQLEATRAEIRNHDIEPTGEVQVGIPPGLNMAIGVPLLLECNRRYPKLKLRIAEMLSGHVADYLKQGEIQLGILYTALETVKLTSTLVQHERMILIGPRDAPADLPALGQDETVSYERLAELPIIMTAAGHTIRDFLDQEMGRRGLALNYIHEIDSRHGLIALVIEGKGYSIFPCTAAPRELVRMWSIGPPPLLGSIYLAQQKTPALPHAIKAVTELFRSEIAKIV